MSALSTGHTIISTHASPAHTQPTSIYKATRIKYLCPLNYEHLAFKERTKRAYLTEINQGFEANASLPVVVFGIAFRAIPNCLSGNPFQTCLPVQPPSQNFDSAYRDFSPPVAQQIVAEPAGGAELSQDVGKYAYLHVYEFVRVSICLSVPACLPTCLDGVGICP
jgi:hypothetical protein